MFYADYKVQRLVLSTLISYALFGLVVYLNGKSTNVCVKYYVIKIFVTWMYSFPLMFFMVYIPECKQQLRTMK